ncbi:MAG: GNAT family N-acetyltransferase [Bacteroidota bacterium]
MKYLLQGETTNRLKFRLLDASDFDDWLPLFETENIVPFLGLDPKLSVTERCEFWFEKAFKRYANDTGGMNVLVDKKTGKMVGQAGLLIQDVNGEERMEIGYSILPQHWRKGYAFEAAQKCKNYAFENNFSSRLMSMVHPDNVGSEKVARRNGMTHETYLEFYKGTPVNIFSIEKKNWLETQRAS